jgi:hypothetical protein
VLRVLYFFYKKYIKNSFYHASNDYVDIHDFDLDDVQRDCADIDENVRLLNAHGNARDCGSDYDCDYDCGHGSENVRDLHVQKQKYPLTRVKKKFF